MAHHSYNPGGGVCSRAIDFDIDADGIVHNVRFTGGCPGNTHGVASLADGMKATDLIHRLRGTDCRGKGTSCPDQFAQALEAALNQER